LFLLEKKEFIMIADLLSNASRYLTVLKNLDRAFQYLKEIDLSTVADGRYEIEGKSVFAILSSYNTKPIEECKFEAHRRYVDLQYIVSGEELIGYAPLAGQEVLIPYNEEKDALFIAGDSSMIKMSAGMFAVFFPQDAHRPGIQINAPQAVRKVVVKILVS
jgi:YhcH/YjgK/YiaL family protein